MSEIKYVSLDYDDIIDFTGKAYVMEFSKNAFGDKYSKPREAFIPLSQVKEHNKEKKFIVIPEWLYLNNIQKIKI
jgi:hypothetical protein